MQPDHRARYTFGFALLAALLAALILWNLNTGSLHLSPAEVMDILLTRTGENAAIVWEMRLPRLIAAMLLGGALSISGFLLQTFFANPIAGPFVLGISSGAKLTVSLAMIGLLSRGRVIGSTGMILAAFCGAMLSMGFVLALAQRVRQMSLLIIAGVMVGYICSAVTDFVVTFAEDSNIVNLHNWSQGSFSGISWDNICVMAPVVLISLALAVLLSKPMSAYQLGEGCARSMGVNIRAFRAALILLSSVLSACVAAFAGPISFVGIAVPQLMKGLFGTLCRRRGILSVLRSGRAHGLCPHRAQHQLGHGHPRRAHRNLHHGAPPHTHAVKGENAMADQLLRAENMTVGYGGVPLIRDIALSVSGGEILTLVGPNGSGKSTILKSLIRELALLGGTVYLDGRDSSRLSAAETARTLAVMMTGRIAPERMTCWDVAAAGRYPYTGRLGILGAEDREKVCEALALVHAEELADRDFTCISDGQRQRVLLARAICQQPRVLILDEPTSFLDIRYKLELLTILKDLVRERSVAVVLSLHELDLAQKISDRVICVAHGEIARVGTPEEVFTDGSVQRLYGLTAGSYDERFGSLELEPVRGAPQALVIGGGGSGIALYRALQRHGIPFAAGVLHENDMDFPVARALACEIVSEQPYQPIGDAAQSRVRALMHACRCVYAPLRTFGPMNEGNRLLIAEAAENGWLVSAISPKKPDAT